MATRPPSNKTAVSISNITPTIALMKKYGSGFSRMVRDDVTKNVAPLVASKVQAKANGSTGQAAAVARTFRPVRDRLPAIRGLGSTRVGSSKVAAGDIGFGANWGGGQKLKAYRTRSPLGRTYVVNRHTTRQFGAWTGGGPQDRFIYSTIHENQRAIEEAWQAALDRAYVEWNRR
jgi:hypothetical protein